MPTDTALAPSARARPFARLSPALVLGLVFGTLLLALLAYYQRGVRLRHGSVLLGAGVMLVFAGAVALRHRSWAPARAMVYDWLPIILAVSIYENLHDLTVVIRPQVVDPQLAALDEWIFGVQPTLWLEGIARPWLTDYLSLCYTTYFFIPPLLAGLLYVRGEVGRFREFQLIVLLAFYAGFAGYVAVPAVGPRYELIAAYGGKLSGLYYSWSDSVMTNLAAVARDCFPSLHTAISTIWLISAFRLRALLPARRVVLPVLVVITVSLWFSTVYLRYHWVVDVFAGWVLAFGADRVGRWVHAWWYRDEAAPALAGGRLEAGPQA